MISRTLAASMTFTAVLSAGTALAAPSALLTRHVPKEADAAHFAGRVPDTQQFRLAISLPLRNEATLDRLLQKVSDPRSPEYRHYLTTKDFTDRFGPSASDYATLHGFAAAHHLAVKADFANRFVLDVQGSAASIREAFGVQLNVYRHSRDGSAFYAPDREPAMDIGIPVLHVSGLDNAQLPVAHAVHGVNTQRTIQANGTAPNGDYSATDIRNAYYGGSTLTGTGQIVALVEFESYYNGDITAYFNTFHQTVTVPIVGINLDGMTASCTSTCEDTEAAIDVEQVIGMAPGLKQLSFYIGNQPMDILNRIASDNTAKIISSSYGWGAEADVEDPVYKEFQAQGQTFVDGTGDDGSNLAAGGVWPGDDQLVTGIGGTVLTTQWSGGPWASETGWSGSGGGISPDGVKLPKWQKPFVSTRNQGSSSLRNVPDVAMEAAYDSYLCYDNKCDGGWGGTSFSAPRWAGFLALIDQQAEMDGKKPIGALNKALCALAAGSGYDSDFHDITSGSNGGYTAVTGYDLVTGFGSPTPALITALASGTRFK